VAIGTPANFVDAGGAFNALNPGVESTPCQYVVDSECATSAAGATCTINGNELRIDRYSAGTDEWVCTRADGSASAIKVKFAMLR
jgi:hypothetical protein